MTLITPLFAIDLRDLTADGRGVFRGAPPDDAKKLSGRNVAYVFTLSARCAVARKCDEHGGNERDNRRPRIDTPRLGNDTVTRHRRMPEEETGWLAGRSRIVTCRGIDSVTHAPRRIVNAILEGAPFNSPDAVRHGAAGANRTCK